VLPSRRNLTRLRQARKPSLGAVYTIPAHRHLTNFDQARCHICNNLVSRLEKIGEHIDNGGDLAEVYHADQMAYGDLDSI